MDSVSFSTFSLFCFSTSEQVFRHNDPVHLEQVVRKAIIDGQPRTHRPWNKILIVVEGIYRYVFFEEIRESHGILTMGFIFFAVWKEKFWPCLKLSISRTSTIVISTLMRLIVLVPWERQDEESVNTGEY